MPSWRGIAMLRSNRRLGAVLIALLAALAASGTAVGGAWAQGASGIEALLERFARMPGLQARFREEKHIGLLAAPIVNEGTLHFAPPDRLVRRVRRPHRSTLLVRGDRLRVRDGGRTRSVDLSESPMVRAFVDSFRALLAGDRRALESHFELALEGKGSGEGAWHLTMRPRDPGLRRAIRRISVDGRGVVLERLVVEERNGDRSVTTFSEVDPSRRYGRDELRRVFRIR